MSTTRATRRLALLLLAPGLLLTACAGGDDGGDEATATPAPLPTLPSAEATEDATPEPTPSETLTKEQQAEAGAEEAIILTTAAMSRVLQDPENYDPLTEARAFAGSGLMEELTRARDAQLTANLRTEGEIAIRAMEVTQADYTGADSNGAPTLEVTTCIDSSQLKFFRDGVLVEDASGSPTETTIFGVSYWDHVDPAGWYVIYGRPAEGEQQPC